MKKILGYFIVGDILRLDIRTLWMACKDIAGITKEVFDAYYNGTHHGIGIYVENPTKFKKLIDPLELNPNFRSPQNFMYVRKDLEKKLEKIDEVKK